jgi:hypothetical protein
LKKSEKADELEGFMIVTDENRGLELKIDFSRISKEEVIRMIREFKA